MKKSKNCSSPSSQHKVIHEKTKKKTRDNLKQVDENNGNEHDEEDATILIPSSSTLGASKSNQPGIADIFTVEEELNIVEGNWGDDAKTFKFPIGWIVLAGAVMMIILSISAFMIANGTRQSKATAVINSDLLQKEKQQTKTLELALQSTIRSYLSADNLEDKLRVSRNPERVRSMMQHYYKNHSFECLRFDHIGSINFTSFWNRPFVLLMARSSDGKGKFMTVEQTQKNTFKVDWETDVYYQPMLWSDFLKQRPTSSLNMRILVQPDNHYAYQFRDETQYECFRLISRNKKFSAYGYAKRGSPVWQDLRRFFSLRRKSNLEGEPLILQIRFPEKNLALPDDKGIIIEKFISNQWLL